ncbi:MAG: MFS transporter [Myxococcales bacterium]|nr:MFS transporter [Myxococcales bacterium]
MRARPSGAAALAGFYFLYFGAVGVTLPFLPAYFKFLGLSVTQIGALLAVGPAFALVSPPLWGHLADRTGRPERVLSAIGLGACLGFAPLLLAERFAPIMLSLAAYAFFGASVTTVLDSLALLHLSRTGGSYARLRAVGSLGFVVSSTAFGLSVSQVDRTAVWVPLLIMGGYFFVSFALPSVPLSQAESLAPPPLLGGPALLGRRDLRLGLLACALHWIACAPFHGTFAIHVGALGLPPSVVGISAGLAVTVEIGVMLVYPQLSDRIAPRHLLAISFAASAARWMGMSVAEHPVAIVALQAIHGLTFGAFFVAAVAYVARRVPESMRATGQALFVSVTFGVGGLVGFLSSGVGYDALGGQRLFAVAAAVEMVAAAIALSLPPVERAVR